MTPTARRIIRPTITSWFNSASISVTTTEAFTALSSRGKRNSSEGSCDFPPRLATKNNAHRATFNPWARCSHLFAGWAKVKDRKHPATMEKSSRGRMASLGCFLASVAFKTRRSA